MAAALLSEDRSYGLKCGRSGGRGVSVFHVKLTESALRAVERFRGFQDEACVQPRVQFKGLQGRIKVPRSGSSSELQTFEFYLSNVSKDNPQGSFECLQQHVSGSGAPGLSLLAPVQSKLTVCDTNHSYQDKTIQPEEDTRERCTKVIKRGGHFRGKPVQSRKPALTGADVVPERKRSTPINPANTLRKCLSNNAVSQRPLRDRILHLLALRAYKKLELLARLQRDGISQKDRSSLGTTLQQVAVLNTKENTYSLKEFRFRDVQKEWPGYTEDERTQAERNVTRKLGLTPEPPSSSSPKDVAPCCSPQKRLVDIDFIDPLAPKKPRISHLSHRALSATSSEEQPSCAPAVPSSVPLDHRDGLSAHPQAAVNHQLSPASSSHSPSTPEGCGTQALPLDQSSTCRDPRTPSPQQEPRKAKKKSKKHKEKERREEVSRGPAGDDRESRKANKRRKGEGVLREPDSTLPQEVLQAPQEVLQAPQEVLQAPQEVLQASEFSSSRQLQDYQLKYPALSSLEQRQSYKDDFNSEYDEYRRLHARVESTTRRFTRLDAQVRSLTPGTQEHQKVQEEVLKEYKKIKQLSPNYQAEKQRCEYLHNKLSHIKRLISHYDHKRAQCWS